MDLTTKNQLEPSNDLDIIRKAVFGAKLLMFFLFGSVISIYGMLFGPRWTWILGVAPFVLIAALGLKSRDPMGERFRQACPQGLAGRFPRLRSFEKAIRTLALTAVTVATVSIATMFIAERGDGVANDSQPVFAERKQYRLNQHSKMTEVSRLRFCVSGASGVIALNFASMFATTLALHALLYGGLPKKLGEFHKQPSPVQGTN